MVARNVVDNILAHDKPVPIPVRFRAPPNRIFKLVQFQRRGLNFFYFFFVLPVFSRTVLYVMNLGRRDDALKYAGMYT